MELTLNEPCVLFALRREASAFLREFRPSERFRGSPCRAWFCGPAWLNVLVVETGVGAAATETALEWVLGKPMFGNLPYRPKIVISAGYSGALQDGLGVGDLVLATEVVDGAGEARPATWPGELPAGAWDPPMHRGRLLSLVEMQGDAARKRALGAEHNCAAVDMETAVVARLCHRHNIPFGCLRVISDAVTTSLSPKLLKVLQGGRVSPVRLALTVLTSPGIVGELWRLRGDTATASARLGKGLGELLTLTLEWMKEEGT